MVIFTDGDEQGWAGVSVKVRLIADGAMDRSRVGEALASDGTLLAASGHDEVEGPSVGNSRGAVHRFAAALWSP